MNDVEILITYFCIQFGKQLVTDYDTTKEKCPWMLLENENIEVEQAKRETSPTDLSTATEDELNALVSN